MIHTHNLGFPRIGGQRELKLALESYWRGETSADQLSATGAQLRQRHWHDQSSLDFVPVGDFSFYDQVLDMSFTLGHLPDRFKDFSGEQLDNYFRVARGQSAHHAHSDCHCQHALAAGEMTKWFDTNYHYIVPEFKADTSFELNASRLLDQIKEAQTLGLAAKPVIIGPVTYLALGKAKDNAHPLDLLPQLLPIYAQLLHLLAEHGVQWVQIDEPILVTELDAAWQHAFNTAYHQLKACPISILLATYFGQLQENTYLAAHLPVAGLHIDVSQNHDDLSALLNLLPSHKVLSLGVISGRNIWKTDLTQTLDWLEPIAKKLRDKLWLAPSCSLLHVPVDLNNESEMDQEVQTWLAFAIQKLDELHTLAQALNHGRSHVQEALSQNSKALESRRRSTRVHQSDVQNKIAQITPLLGQRQSDYAQRAQCQSAHLNLPLYPTTTIGSFPQTNEIRQARKQFKEGVISQDQYQSIMQSNIQVCVNEQEALDLDVLVHGEAERNDMVEYFGEQLQGYAFSQFGWVQSYGSRCVKPPILFGDISRPHPMTVAWTAYAQSLTRKPMKGMLTGPVTMLNWSFVRDDQPRQLTCQQLALAIRDEVLDLEKAGVRIIQIDEAALREGLPLRRSQWENYLHWAVECFRLTANGVSDATQIHTHMCYSEFNDIIAAIAQMDADVITIETSRSDMELLDAFDHFNYPNEIGPGVYDIHSPNIPTEHQITELMKKAAQRIPAKRLWINPDCGLKTRQWKEVLPALKNMVAAAHTLRTHSSETTDA